MVDNVAACKKLKLLAEYYRELKQIAGNLTLETYKSQVLLKRAVEREIQLIVECATDINNMILKQLNKGPAKDYFNSFLDLAENNVLEMDFVLQIAPSTGLRNILVYQYQAIDDDIVYKSIEKVFVYYLRYMEKISAYLGCE